MSVIVITVVVQGILTPREQRGSFDKSLLVINDGIFQAIGVISFGTVQFHPFAILGHSLTQHQPLSVTTTPSSSTAPSSDQQLTAFPA